MINSIISSNNLKQVINRFIFLVVLFSSANVLAETRALPVYGTTQYNDQGCNVTVYQAVDSDKAVERKKSANKESCNSKRASTRRVFIDDFERILRPVTKSQKREMVWLGQRNLAD